MMTDPHVAAVRAAPDDDLPRLIYADYLEERGDPRGPFIRAQVELTRLDQADPRRPELQAAEAELLALHEADWVGPLADGLYRWWFHRGFLEVSLDLKRYLHEPNPWLEQPTVAGVLLYAPPSMPPGLLGDLANSERAMRVRSLHLGFEWLRDAGVAALLNSPRLAHLAELDLRTNGLTDTAAAGLAETPNLPALRYLSLANNLIGDAGAAALAHRLGLVRLDLSQNEITSNGAMALAGSPGFGGLESLRLAGNSFGGRCRWGTSAATAVHTGGQHRLNHQLANRAAFVVTMKRPGDAIRPDVEGSLVTNTEPSFVGDAVVGAGGCIELQTPLPENSRVTVAVFAADDFRDLVAAASTSLGFWDNPLDDEDWNHAGAG